VVDLAAVFVEDLRDLAHIIDLTADIFTCSVAGCMGAQVRLRRECDPRWRVASGFTLWWGGPHSLGSRSSAGASPCWGAGG